MANLTRQKQDARCEETSSKTTVAPTNNEKKEFATMER